MTAKVTAAVTGTGTAAVMVELADALGGLVNLLDVRDGIAGER